MLSRVIAALGVGLLALSAANAQETLFAGLNARPLGPSVMGGRIMDIAVYEKEPRIFYIATASSGLWKTDNGGITVAPVFDRGATAAMGAVAVSQSDPNIVWVGMGEGSSRNSTSWGDGVYMSKDGGKTFSHMGLKETHHITKIFIDPKDNNTVYVGALGRLWGPNPERGVFKTTDGGKTWTHVLKGTNDTTGVADMQMDPKNPNHLLVAMWDRERRPWTFRSGGPGSGLWQTKDGGKKWTQITKGMPEGTIGRIGLSFFRKDPKIVIATVEAAKFGEGSQRTRTGGIFRSTDGGDSWTKVNDLNPRPFYFSTPKQDPLDVNRIYILGVNVHVSDDAGKTFRNWPINNRVHVDHHAGWIDPSDSNHVLLGNDGGVSQSRDRGTTWEHLNTMVLGQFYAIGWDNRKPYYVYGGLQDNGSWGGPTQTRGEGISFFHWYGVGGGDGFYVQVDPNDWTTLYSESQGGAISRYDQRTGRSQFIQPRQNNVLPAPAQGERFRFNWNAPIFISPHNSQTIYFGGNKLFKSVNRGDVWQVVSPDLTTNDAKKLQPGIESVTPEDTGAERHCTITTIGESPMRAGVVWVGTDDGQVQVTQDDGKTWTNVTANIPDLAANAWVTRVAPSRHSLGRCYVTFDNHRLNDFKTYVYVTDDFGKTWKSLVQGGLSAEEPAHVIREGLRNPNLLYLGTEMGLWMSFDMGGTWTKFKNNNFPTVPVHDLAIHPRELDLIIGTHGRSIWTLNVAPLEEATADNLGKDVHLTRPQNVLLLGMQTQSTGDGDRLWVAPNTQPGTDIAYYVKTAVPTPGKIEIQDAAGAVVMEMDASGAVGLNVIRLNARGRMRLQVGDYRVVLKLGGKEYTTSLKVEQATWEQ